MQPLENTPICSNKRKPGQKIDLIKPISAIQISLLDDGAEKLGLLTQLGPGLTIEICGAGINDRTVRVHCRAGEYVVFEEDLHVQEPLADSKAIHSDRPAVVKKREQIVCSILTNSSRVAGFEK